MKRNQLQRYRGYTVVELMIAIISAVALVGACLGGYAIVHFIAKAW